MPVSDTELAEIVSSSASITEVYARSNVSGGGSKNRIRLRVRALCLSLEHFDKHPRIKRKELFERCIELRHSGLGYVRIGDVTGVPWRTVSNWVRHIKIPRQISQALCAQRQIKEFPTSKWAIRKRLLEKRGNACEECGLSEWMGLPLSMELHRLALGRYSEVPLKLLCPNCHSLTKNWRGKGKVYKLAPVA